MLVVRDLKSKAVFAHAVVAKAVDEKGLIIDTIVKDIVWIGYSRVILKLDNWPAIVKVLRDLIRLVVHTQLRTTRKPMAALRWL